jgi:hypothetical protein
MTIHSTRILNTRNLKKLKHNLHDAIYQENLDNIKSIILQIENILGSKPALKEYLKASLNERRGYLMSMAIENERLPIVKYLVSIGAKVYPWHLDGAYKIETIKYLVDQGADINYINYNDNSQLPIIFQRIANRDLVIVKWLINNGADLNIAVYMPNFQKKINALDYANIRLQRMEQIALDPDWDPIRSSEFVKNSKRIVQLLQMTLNLKRTKYSSRNQSHLADIIRSNPKIRQMEGTIRGYLAFGKINIRKRAKSLNIKLTVIRNGKRVYKTDNVLLKQINQK